MGYRNRLSRKVLAGTLTVAEAQQMLGRRKAQKKFRKSQGKLTSGTVKTAGVTANAVRDAVFAGVAEATSPAFIAKSQTPVVTTSAPAAITGADIFERYWLHSENPAEREAAWREVHPSGRP